MPVDTSRKALDLLVLGGTSWLGGRIAAVATERGHRVSCLARGDSGTPPGGVTWVRADRTAPAAYDGVAERDWDAVVDVSWQPDLVRSALLALRDRARHWVYVSSGSVYADDTTPGTGEEATLLPAHEGTGPVGVGDYGPAKVACEQACLSTLGQERVLVARAGLIGGYGDRSDRLGYWPARVARAGDGDAVLVPPREAPVQVVDVEDLALWLVVTAEERTAGVFNVVGDVTSVGAVLEASVAAAGRSPRFVETGDEWLAAHDVEPWMGEESLPLWLPRDAYAGFSTRSNEAARHAGLRLRPLAATVEAALRWERERGLERDRRAGLTPRRERELLAELESS